MALKRLKEEEDQESGTVAPTTAPQGAAYWIVQGIELETLQ